MAEALGFLSYTRKDDQFFGGYITAFRKTLEAGVQVVTSKASCSASNGRRSSRK